MEERNSTIVFKEVKERKISYQDLLRENAYLRQENKSLHQENEQLREIFRIATIEFDRYNTREKLDHFLG